MLKEAPQFEPMPLERAPVVVSFLGPPGVGKSTQERLFRADLLSCSPDLTDEQMNEIAAKKGIRISKVGLGPIMRGLQSKEPNESVRRYQGLLNKYITDSNKGDLVPDEVAMKVITDQVMESVDLATENNEQLVVIMDGAPRTLKQEELLEKEIMSKISGAARMAIHFDANREILEERIFTGDRGRGDDKPKVVGQRFENYETYTVPMTDVLLERGIARRVKADGTIKDIQSKIYNDPDAPHFEEASIFRTDLFPLEADREEVAA